MAANYDISDLKKIGTQCKTRLPPTSAVQAMFMYELQREAEVQAAFQGQMFELARVKDTTKSHEPRIWDLEEQMKDVQTKANRQDIDERLATSKVRTYALAARLNEHFIRLGEYGRRLTDVEAALTTTQEAKKKENAMLDGFTADIKTLKSDVEIAQTAIASQCHQSNAKHDTITAELVGQRAEISTLITQSSALTTEIKAIQSTLTTADKDIETLFAERDGLFDLHKTANDRIAKLEDLVRALTLQKASPTTSTGPSAGSSCSPSVHFLPVTAKNGNSVDLVVPKGKGFVTGKEDVKPFVPGKVWGA